MALKLMYITNIPQVALIAEKTGVDRVMIDLETLGKDERQKNMNTVKSHHTVSDVSAVSKVLTTAKLLVRINPWNENSISEIDDVIAAGAKRIMLPMWKTAEEVNAFLSTVNNRVHTVLLLETKEAAEIIDNVLENPLLDEIHIGLNDLHLSYGLTFMFELLANGVVENLCRKFKAKGIPYGFGGIAKLDEGLIPARRIIMEHYRLGSTAAILSRSFCNAEEIKSIVEIEDIFSENMQYLRQFETLLPSFTKEEFTENTKYINKMVKQITKHIKESE